MATWTTNKFPLIKYMKGDLVKNLQAKLGVTADGYMGDNTIKALQTKYKVSSCSETLYNQIVGGTTNNTTNDTTNKKTNNSTTPTSYVAESFPLAKGMQGDNIKTLQTKLGITSDGKFWTATETALKNKYGVTTCSKDLFEQITGSKANDTTNNNSSKKQKIVKTAIIAGTVLVAGVLIYSLINSNDETKYTQPALNGVTKRRRSKKHRVSRKPIALK